MKTENKIFLSEGEKVSLRLMTSDDTDLIVKWRNNPRVRNNFIFREPFTRQIHEEWLKNVIAAQKAVQFIICENSSKRPIGSVYFRDIDNSARTAEYGIFIGEDDAVGKGYGNETAVLATDYAKEAMKLKALILRVFKSNEAAIKSYEHAGFAKKAELPMVLCSDGQKSDMILMEKIL